MFEVDQAHENMDIFQSRMSQDIWRNKYRWKDEPTPFHSMRRIADALFPEMVVDGGTDQKSWGWKAFCAMKAGLWLPGGRISAGAGTDKRVTLMNCYVNETVVDSMEGIMHALTNTALTLQQGGGIGTDFSTLRPEGAILHRTHTKASGPLPFMHTWDATSRTIRSAGDRRGAMMATMSDTHPDLIKFIEAKTTKGALEQFNVSILVSDALMEAVREGEDWLFYFPVEPFTRPPTAVEYDFVDENGVKQFVYDVIPARELWSLITKHTYDYSEPGVIFIDRVNDLNNLWYCEEIRCTNPCGEQPLPPHGTCNLGHINLARVVRKPFTTEADIDFDLIKNVVQVGVRFLDRVIDITQYPLSAQKQEEENKRRLGLGFTGLADMLAQLRVRYGSPEAIRITEEVMRVICFTAYETSCTLARETSSFPLFDQEKFLGGGSFAATALPEYIKDMIRSNGIRNSLLLTVAPTGTGSVYYGNVSSGGEPVFLHKTQRRVLRPVTNFADEWDTYVEWGYGAKLYHSIHGEGELPNYMVTTEDLSVEDHVVMQAAAQRYIDASMSKTVNIPKDYSYESFVKVYELAYSLGCKGCTTYRPSEVRGAILTKPDSIQTAKEELRQRPETLEGCTYKIKWPSLASALYLTINHDSEGQPFEVFISSKDSRYHDWTTALTTMITSIWRRGGDISFVGRELQQVQSLNDSAFLQSKFHPSLVAYIGFMLEQHVSGTKNEQTTSPADVLRTTGSACPQCRQLTLEHKEGCKTCSTCGYTSCG